MNPQPASTAARFKRLLSVDFWRSIGDPRQSTSLPARLFRVLRLLLRGYIDDNLTIHASSLTFATLTSLVPILAVCFALIKGFGMGDEIINRVRTAEWLTEMPAQYQEFVNRIVEMVNSTNFSALGGIGLAFFILTATLLLANVEKSFNLVWGVEKNRSLPHQIMNYTSVLVLVPILLIAAGAAKAQIVIHQQIIGNVDANVWFQNSASFLALWLAFAFLFLFVPNTRVRIRPALIGSLTTTIIFIIWMKAFMILQMGVSRNNAIYGAFAAIPVFMFWLYVTWVILLLGAEFTFSLQNSETYGLEGGVASMRTRIIIALLMLRSAGRAAETQAGLFDASEFARIKHAPIRLINAVLNTLVTRNYLVPVASENGNAFVLRHGPENIYIRDLIADLMTEGSSTFDLAGGITVDPPLEKILNKMNEGIETSFDRLTLADIVAEQRNYYATQKLISDDERAIREPTGIRALHAPANHS